MEFAPLGVGLEDTLNRLSSAHWQSGFLDHDLVALRDFSDFTSTLLDIAQIRRAPSADAISLGRRVDTHKDDVRITDRSINIGREK